MGKMVTLTIKGCGTVEEQKSLDWLFLTNLKFLSFKMLGTSFHLDLLIG